MTAASDFKKTLLKTNRDIDFETDAE